VPDVHGTVPTLDGRPPLCMIGQSMDASGFARLASLVQAEDVPAIIAALGAGQAETFGSSGGAVTALALVAVHPGDMTTLVAHEPPIIAVLPDVGASERARNAITEAYNAKSWGAGSATLVGIAAWRGEFTDAYFAQPTTDPAACGMWVMVVEG
jgi:pimeloyl-ACP methyl ester carboxylesterase